LKRRGVLRALAALPVAATLPSPSAEARDYTGPGEVFAAVESFSRVVEARLEAILRRVPGARAFVRSAAADLVRHRAQREALAIYRAPKATAGSHVDDAASLPGLRESLVELMYAHAEGLPALRDGDAVARLTAHMIDLSRLVTVVDLWLEAEGIE
jgi:hypothetical protein